MTIPLWTRGDLNAFFLLTDEPAAYNLPERPVLARELHLPSRDVLAVILADEVERRDDTGAALRAKVGRLDATTTIDH